MGFILIGLGCINMTEKKILYIASRPSHISNFHSPYIHNLENAGYTVHTATEGFEKDNGLYKNIKVLIGLIRLIRREKYSLISTHSTLAGFLGRLAAGAAMSKARILHTSHGYLFNDDGSPKSHLMIFAEKIFASRTDALFVMNKDDYSIAAKYKLCRQIVLINGMGIDAGRLKTHTNAEMERTKEKYGIPPDKKYLLCVGEFSKRKSQECVIRALKAHTNRFPEPNNHYHIIFLGSGALFERCKAVCGGLGLTGRVTFCGHVDETGCFYRMAHCVISASKYEGLPFNVMEALYYGKPVIASDVKGHKDLIKNGFNGYLYEYGDYVRLSELFDKIPDIDPANVFLDDKYLLCNVKGKIMAHYTGL
jgi:glycosyltransferase EpsD